MCHYAQLMQLGIKLEHGPNVHSRQALPTKQSPSPEISEIYWVLYYFAWMDAHGCVQASPLFP